MKNLLKEDLASDMERLREDILHIEKHIGERETKLILDEIKENVSTMEKNMFKLNKASIYTDGRILDNKIWIDQYLNWMDLK